MCYAFLFSIFLNRCVSYQYSFRLEIVIFWNKPPFFCRQKCASLLSRSSREIHSSLNWIETPVEKDWISRRKTKDNSFMLNQTTILRIRSRIRCAFFCMSFLNLACHLTVPLNILRGFLQAPQESQMFIRFLYCILHI